MCTICDDVSLGKVPGRKVPAEVCIQELLNMIDSTTHSDIHSIATTAAQPPKRRHLPHYKQPKDAIHNFLTPILLHRIPRFKTLGAIEGSGVP